MIDDYPEISTSAKQSIIDENFAILEDTSPSREIRATFVDLRPRLT
jgi:hypothetical protein